MQGFTYIDLAILIVYLAAVLFAGLHFAKKEMKGKEYFKSDGTVPWWVTSVSIFATLLSPPSCHWQEIHTREHGSCGLHS